MINLLARGSDNPVSVGRRNIAIAEIVLWSIIHLLQVTLRYQQEWRYWHHTRNRKPGRCLFYSWFSMIGILAQLRIAGSSMILATRHPNKSMLIAESAMQSAGLSPLLFEISLLLLACGQAGRFGPGHSRYSKAMRFTLHGFRFPIFIAIVLAIVGGIVEIRALSEVGSVVLVVTFAFVCGLLVWLTVKARSMTSVEGHRGILLVSLALPFLLVRIIYFLLQAYGPPKFDPASGDVGPLAGMGLLMEISVIALFLAARAVAEPVWTSENTKRIWNAA